MSGPDRSIDGDRVAWAEGLEPAVVWTEFAELSAIPRRSKHEQAVREHVGRPAHGVPASRPRWTRSAT